MNKKEFIIILSITFFVVMVWVITEIIHSKPTIAPDPKLNKILEPINPNFDQTVLEQIK